MLWRVDALAQEHDVWALHAQPSSNALVSEKLRRKVASDVILLLLKVFSNPVHHLLHRQASKLRRIICIYEEHS